MKMVQLTICLLIISLFSSCNSNQQIKEAVVLGGGWANTKATVVRLNEVAKELGLTIKVKEILVDNELDAKKFGMIGSPSVQINGKDIEPSVRKNKATGFTWRLYSRVSGIPSKELIVQAFKEAGWIK